ncbi:MAG: hypothetical protein ACI39R_07395 [Lachnospiraceae bacterium]
MGTNRFIKIKLKKIGRALCIASLPFLLLTGCGTEKNQTPQNMISTEVEPTETPSVTDEPTPELTIEPTATPTPTPRPDYGVTTMSLYKNYRDEGVRKKVNGSFESVWVQGQDISSFEAIASQEESIATDGRYFQDLWKSYWNSFENHEDCKIGYFVSFDLKSGEHIQEMILEPDDVNGYSNYIENYLYDDINQIPGEWYSHLLQSEVNDDTVISSIKFTAGKDIDQVDDIITLTAFVYYSRDDFDDNGNYVGNVSYTITIKNVG